MINFVFLHVRHPGDLQEPDEGYSGCVHKGLLPSPPARRHDVHLVGVIGVEIRHNVTRVHRIDIEIVVIVIVVINVVVHIEYKREDSSRECREINSLGSTNDGGALGVTTGLNRWPLIDEGQIPLDKLFLAVSCLIIFFSDWIEFFQVFRVYDYP